MKYNTIIIGGGIGGAALGALLSSAGQKVLLLDKNRIIGGRCASYERDGFVIDLGVHLFGLGDKGPLGEVCRRAGEPDAIQWVLARNPRVSIHFRGETKTMTREMMMGQVDKKEMGALGNMFMSVMSLKEADLDKLWYTPLKTWISGFTSDPNIHRLFAMLCGIYLCISPEEASAAEFIKSFRDLGLSRSSGYPKGGCVAIPRAYQRIIEKHCGEVRLRAPAQKIIIENGEAKGVVVNGENIFSDRVVSNADIKSTIKTLAGAENFPSDYVARVNSLTYTAHVLALKVALDTVITDQKMVMYAPNVSDEQMAELERKYMRGEVPEVAGGMLNSPTNFDPSLAPEGKQLIFFGTKCAPHQDWKKWGGLCMNALKEVFPGIEKHVMWTILDSPDVIEQYAGEGGNVIGVGQTVDQIHERRPKHETPVRNLFLCSAEAGGHGIGTELAASSALELADKILGPLA